VRELDPAWLRQQIATVMQEPTLFSRTVGENIGYGVASADDRAIAAAASWASADEFIAHLPDGFDAPIGDRGVQLSGGQRQRLAIARALLRRPKILILDEATSALDAATEAKVQAALEEVMKGRTTFVIAHRLATVRKASRILLLDGGRIVESGGFDELVARRERFAALARAQFLAAPAQEGNVAEREG